MNIKSIVVSLGNQSVLLNFIITEQGSYIDIKNALQLYSGKGLKYILFQLREFLLVADIIINEDASFINCAYFFKRHFCDGIVFFDKEKPVAYGKKRFNNEQGFNKMSFKQEMKNSNKI